MNTLSERFREAREREGLTQVMAAEKLNIPVTHYADIENITHCADALADEFLASAASILNVGGHWLRTGKGMMRPDDRDSFGATNV